MLGTILDEHVGGGLLPHVYCKKITLERWDNPETALSPHSVKVTFRFEIYEQVKKLLESQWLNDLGGDNLASSILDHLYIQLVVYRTSDDIARLRASHDPLGDPDKGESNIYLAESKGDAFLPRGPLHGDWVGQALSLPKNEGHFYPTSVPVESQGFAGALTPIKVRTSSLLGDLSNADVLSSEKQGKVRTEIKDGKEYYVIPFRTSIQFNPDIEKLHDGQYNNLGVAFYTFLHTPGWMMHNDFWQEEFDEFFEQYVVEGPVNTEIVFLGGNVQGTREVFMRPGGKVWEGSVHLHATGDNPAPDGYAGDGGFGPNRGWMVGAVHKPGADQTRLELAQMPNNKIEDFRFTLKPEPLSSYIGFGATPGGYVPESGISQIPTEGFGPNYKNLLSLQNIFLSPFQKEARRYLQKIGGDPYTGNGAHSLFDNDSEYSKLYVCRDVGNNARGLFFINFQNLLNNNSFIYPTLINRTPGAENLKQAFKDEILSYSKILELRLYRDRVKKQTINTYEKFANDEFYEEPSQLVGKISDLSGYNSPIQSPELAELSLGGINGDSFANRFFMFSDTFPGAHSTGKYQYRLELDFKDGTYHFLYKLLRDLEHAKVNLESYYDLATSGFVQDGLNIEYSAGYVGDLKHPDSYLKANFKSYFDDVYDSFRDPEFVDAAYKRFENGDYFPWTEAPPLISKMQEIFGIFPEWAGAVEPQIIAMIDPVYGSPKGISFFIRMLGICITKIEKLIDSTKVSKKSDLNTVNLGADATTEYNLKSQFGYDISSDSIIYEHYTFDHPNEIFESVQNESVYVDYLSVGLPLDENFYGLRSLSPGYFDNRCRLDVLKFSDAVLTDFYGELSPNNANTLPGNIAMFKEEILGDGLGTAIVYDTDYSPDKHDSFSNQAYSFLTPSIITLSNTSNGAESYNFHHSSFSQEAMGYIAGDLPLFPGASSGLHEDFSTWLNYEKLLVALSNYKLNTITKGDLDLSDGYYDGQYSQVVDTLAFETKETYKRYFDNVSLTFHSAVMHDKFYNPVVVPSWPVEEIDPNAPLDLQENYSDASLLSSEYFKSLTYSQKQNIIKIPRGSQSPAALSMADYSENLPNSFKIYWVHKNRENFGETNQANSIMQTAFANPSSFSPFFFVHIQMTARIEVFRGASFPKKDENSWSLMKQEDLNLQSDQKLFCRIRYYNEKFLQGIQECLPVLDKYFLVYPEAKAGIPSYVPTPAPTEPERTFEHPGPREWEAQHRDKIEEFRTMTQKGISDRSAPRELPPYEEIYGPDPVPTDRPVTETAAANTPARTSESPARAQPGATTTTAAGFEYQANTGVVAGIEVQEGTPAAPSMPMGGGSNGSGIGGEGGY